MVKNRMVMTLVIFLVMLLGISGCMTRCDKADTLISGGITYSCKNGDWVDPEGKPKSAPDAVAQPTEDPYPVNVTVRDVWWACVTYYNAGFLKGGIGYDQNSGPKGTEIDCPDSGYPVKSREKSYHYTYQENGGRIVESTPYLGKTEWDQVNPGNYRCIKNFYKYDWSYACIPE